MKSFIVGLVVLYLVSTINTSSPAKPNGKYIIDSIHNSYLIYIKYRIIFNILLHMNNFTVFIINMLVIKIYIMKIYIYLYSVLFINTLNANQFYIYIWKRKSRFYIYFNWDRSPFIVQRIFNDLNNFKIIVGHNYMCLQKPCAGDFLRDSSLKYAEVSHSRRWVWSHISTRWQWVFFQYLWLFHVLFKIIKF